MLKLTLIATTLAFAIFAFAPGAAAQTWTSTVVTERIDYSDLDLTKATDGRAMLGRIRAAARAACAQEPATIMPRSSGEAYHCRMITVARAVEALGSPSVTAVYHARAAKLARR
jgi:UrcA family protein